MTRHPPIKPKLRRPPPGTAHELFASHRSDFIRFGVPRIVFVSSLTGLRDVWKFGEQATCAGKYRRRRFALHRPCVGGSNDWPAKHTAPISQALHRPRVGGSNDWQAKHNAPISQALHRPRVGGSSDWSATSDRLYIKFPKRTDVITRREQSRHSMSERDIVHVAQRQISRRHLQRSTQCQVDMVCQQRQP